MKELTLRPVTQDNWQEALKLTVHPDQLRFVAEYEPIVAVALAKAYIHLGGATWTPFAVYQDANMVGFFELAHWTDAPDQCWIFHFFIDQRYQRCGYGKATLAGLIDLVRREHEACKALLLVVHPENKPAQQLYLAAGFRVTGAVRWGEPVYQLPLADSP
ncbi:MAG: GNAT family N-acetyltransferase [Sulfobacillus sp.]